MSQNKPYILIRHARGVVSGCYGLGASRRRAPVSEEKFHALCLFAASRPLLFSKQKEKRVLFIVEKEDEQARTTLAGEQDMKDRIIHQWRDWLLEYVEAGKYSLIQKENRSVTRTILARTDMDAENQCQQIIKGAKGEPAPSSAEKD